MDASAIRGLAAVLALPVLGLAAQEHGGTAAPAILEQVVVTAQKRVQSLQDVPVSVGVADPQALREAGGFDAGALENYVSNVEIDVDPQAPVIGIRGFATETDNVGFDPSVGLSLDYLALGRPEFIADGLFDIERIEVLRGTQGTLFGKNTIAGVINFLSAEPAPELAGDLLASLGDPDQERFEGGLSVPLGDLLSLRLSGLYGAREGEIENSALGRDEGAQRQGAGRLKLLATPGAWSIGLSTQYADTSVDYPPWQIADASEAALDYMRGFDPLAEDDPLDARTSFNTPGSVERQSDLTRALIEYDHGPLGGLDGLVTTAVVGHAGYDLEAIIDIDVSAADVIVTDFRNAFEQDSVELRAAGEAPSLFGWGHALQFVTGVYAYHGKIDSHLDTIAGEHLIDFALSEAGLEALGLGGIPVLGELLDRLPTLSLPIEDRLLRAFSQKAESYAAFGQLNWHLTPRASLIAGLRYGVEEKHAAFDVETVGLGLVGLVVGAETYEAHRRRRETDVSPKLGLQYEWNDDWTGFFTWTRGFKGGGFNATAETPDRLEFEPERAETWEAGVKSRLAGGGLRVNATVYRTDVDDLQVVDFVNVAYEVGNAASARLQGAEIEGDWQPGWPWFSLAASLALSRAEYLSYPNAPAAEEDRVSCGSVPDEQGRHELSGCTLPNAPELSLALSPSLSLPLAGGHTLRWTVDLSYRGDQYSATDLDSHSFQDGYWLLGARLVLGAADERWAMILAGTNLTDQRARDQVFDSSLYADTYVAQQIPLRRVIVSLQYRF